MIRGPLTAELNTKDSPVRRFLDERFTSGPPWLVFVLDTGAVRTGLPLLHLIDSQS
jgi:hypothetical protein